MSKPDSPSPRADALALAVNVLTLQPKNLREFQKHARAFMPDAVEWWREWEEQKKQADQTLRKAARAIAKARKAARPGKAKPPLVNPDTEHAPEDGWEWLAIVLDPADRDRVEGWFPPEAFEARTFLDELPKARGLYPWPNPSLAAKFTLLAALHDLHRPHDTKILEPVFKGAKDNDGARRAEVIVATWCIRAKKGDTERLAALEGYLEEVRVALADPATDAQILRRIAKAFREWGRKAGPPGRKPEDVPEEEREAARQALLLAVGHLDVITRARARYGCAEAVAVFANVFNKLQAAADDHDRGGDLGGYWVWARDLTQKHLPGNVSFPDRLKRWASRLEQEAADRRQAAVAGGPDAAAGRVDEPSGFLGAGDLAKKLNIPKEKMGVLHTRLARFRKKHGSDPNYVISVEAPGPRESRYLHSLDHVRPVIKDLARPA